MNEMPRASKEPEMRNGKKGTAAALFAGTMGLLVAAVTVLRLPVVSAQTAPPTPAAGDFVLVTEWGEYGGSGVAKIDPDTDQIIARASIAGSPRHMAADQARRLAYVSLHYADKVVALKVDTLEVADLVIPGLGRAPIGATLTPDGLRLLVATRGDDGVYSADDRLDVVALDPATWPPTASLVTSIDASALPPVHVTVVSHNEEPPPTGGFDYVADPNFYLQNRSLLKTLAETITSKGATYNFESDWNYLKAVALYDAGSVTNDTGGKNIVRWMREDLGVEVDPHAHETQYNYADVAYLIEQLGVTPSKNVGGFLYDPPDNPQGWEQHSSGISGLVYPSYFWRADHLWGAATYLHQGNDDQSSGIWRPQDRYNFSVDDPNQRLLYIGGGCGGAPGVLQLLDDIQTGRAPADGFYTANLFVAQAILTDQSIAQLGSFIDSLAPQVAQGRLQWVPLTQMADLWRTEYGSQPFQWDCAAAVPTPTPTGTPATLIPSPTRTPTPTPALTPVPGTYTIEAVETWVTAPNDNRLYTRRVQPALATYPGQHFPALIAIPGGTGAGAPLADNLGYRNLAARGFVVVVFNPEGRGTGAPGNLTSEGTEACNGFVHQDDLKAVVEFTSALANVDASNIGVETSSFGIAIGAGALGRYPNLPVSYLVDQEGPHDNRVITFYDAGRELPVCGHLSTVTDPSAGNVAFWAEREAVNYIDAYRGRYLRMQAEIDHAQNPGYFRHSIEMINAGTRPQFGGAGLAAWTRMNGSDIGNPLNTVYPMNDPSQFPTWLTGRLADHPSLNFTYIQELAAVSTWRLSGKKLAVSDKSGDPSKRRISLASTGDALTSVSADDPSAPTVSGGFLDIINPATGEIEGFPLPAANWKGLGTPAGSAGYSYRDSRLTAGPCKTAGIKNGKRLYARCQGAGIDFSLDEATQGALAIRLTLGNGDRYCLLFGGTIVKDEPGAFRAKDAPAPAACP